MAELLSKRVKTKPIDQLSDNRYEFIGLNQAEPNLGAPPLDDYILSSKVTGERRWIPAGTGGGTGGGSLLGLVDVNNQGLTDGSILVYNSTTSKFDVDQSLVDLTDGGNF